MSYAAPPPPPPPPPPPSPSSYPPAGGGYAGSKPDNYLVWSILATVLCCVPFGIVAIISSSKVDGLWSSGQYDAARAASESAKKWTIVAAVLGVIVGVLYGIALALGDTP